MPTVATAAVMSTGRSRSLAPVITASNNGPPCSRTRLRFATVMNGVIMVANLNRVREQGGPLFDAVMTGASERLRPVLMTAAVATVGMIPAALAVGVGSDVQRSLATVVAGGLLVATLM